MHEFYRAFSYSNMQCPRSRCGKILACTAVMIVPVELRSAEEHKELRVSLYGEVPAAQGLQLVAGDHEGQGEDEAPHNNLHDRSTIHVF